MIKKHLDKILIALGCIIIIIAIILKLGTQYEQKKLVADYRKYISDMQNQDISFNKLKDDSKISEKESENQDSLKTSNTLKQSGKIIGILSIPKIDLSVGIGEGVDKETLKYSVGHFEETAMPGKTGNLCIIGHRSYAYGEFFNRLDEIKKDDYIFVESYGKTFKYKVTGSTVVTPDEVSVLDQTKDSEITLITCTPIRIATHRLIVKGILVED
jgi:sortase A